MHVGGHVAGVDGVDAQLGVLDGEDGGELVEGGLARAVAAPARVGLDGGVGADVDDRAAGARRSAGRTACTRASGATALTSRTRRSSSGVEVGEARAAGWGRARWRC